MYGEQAARDAMHKSVVELTSDRIRDIEQVVVAGKPAEALLRVAGQNPATLIVVGNRGLGATEGEVLGSVPREIVRNAVCDVTVIQTSGGGNGGSQHHARSGSSRRAVRPLTVARAESTAEQLTSRGRKMAEIKHIVVGVDGSDSSRAALEWAYDEAAHHGASLVVVNAWHPPSLPMSPPYGHLPPEDYESQPRNEALALLEQFTSAARAQDPAVDVRTSVEEGKNPAEVLIERSTEADLVVVGSRGHGGFVGMLLGSVSQHLVAHANCPVVVVR